MLINRWKKDKEKDKSTGGSHTTSNTSGSTSTSSKSIGGSVKKKRKSGKEGNRTDDDIRRNRGNRREDPRRHTLSGDHHLGVNYQTSNINRSMDLESPLTRVYPASSNSILFDDDPGIMSEVETSSTGFRRGNKQRSSLPVVRTPSKTLERPLGKFISDNKKQLLLRISKA